MAKPIVIGTATRRPGTLQYGQWTAFDYPTGQEEFLPVLIAGGRRPGPCLWLTAGMHGPEHSGPLVVHRLLQAGFPAELRGTLVAIPALTPAGLRTGSRVPYHSAEDPNRLWPDGRPAAEDGSDQPRPTPQEHAFQRLFTRIRETADFLVDLHNAWEGSIPFVLLDRVLYRADVPGDWQRAHALAKRLQGMAESLGFARVREFPAERYVEEKLHRSTSGAAVQLAGIPALTVELGGGLRPDPVILDAAVVGLRNVLRWAGMLPGKPQPLEGVPVPEPGFACRRKRTPHTPVTGLAHHCVSSGELIRAGDPVAEMVDIWGRPMLEEPLSAEADGFVLGLAQGAVFYPGEAVATLAVRDQDPLVAPYPRGYFRSPGRSTHHLKAAERPTASRGRRPRNAS